jgi:hypothetical protein
MQHAMASCSSSFPVNADAVRLWGKEGKRTGIWRTGMCAGRVEKLGSENGNGGTAAELWVGSDGAKKR